MDSEYESSMNTREALDKSLKLLENAWGDSPRAFGASSKTVSDASFNRSRGFDNFLQSTRIRMQDDSMSNLFDTDCSITLLPGEFKKLTEAKSLPTGKYVNTLAQSAQDQLFRDFLDIWLRSCSSEQDIFSALLDYIQCCSDAIGLIQSSEERTSTRLTVHDEKRLQEIEAERNTWKLIYSLYQDRIHAMMVMENEDIENNFDLEKISEKEIMQRLFITEPTVRESQLVIDWLEGNAAESVSGPKLTEYTDKTIPWENTLHELQKKREVPYKSSREIVTELDLDAPRRLNKPLHDLDQEDDDRLTEHVLKEIRCGRLLEAQTLFIHAGQPAKAAIYEGWKLFHDPNYLQVSNPVSRETSSVQGNPDRDIWKICAWRFCEDSKVALKERAALGAFCGHLPSLMSISLSWEDCLWSYLKTTVDIRVEREIRTMSYKTYVDMPAAYWNNEMNVEAVFGEITAHKDSRIRKEAAAPERVVQRNVILDNVPQLMQDVTKWLHGSDMSVGHDIESISPHFLRFLSHLVLFFRQIGRSETESVGDSVIEAYVKMLIEKKECQLVAWYVSQLSQDDQIYYYSSFLEEITEAGEREAALKAAMDAGLNVDLITKTVVENIRQQPCNVDNIGLETQDISPEDWVKISGLDWLRFYPSQRVELLVQGNALVSFFLASNNVLAARMAFNKIPEDTISMVGSRASMFEESFVNLEVENQPKTVSMACREYLCYKTYLNADESFADWFEHFNNAKPVEPVLPANYTFMEKVGYQHKYKLYEADLERWKITMENQTASTKACLYNVLTFPLGWLVDNVEVVDSERSLQLEALRSTVIPKVTFLLHLIMHSMSDFAGCLALADLIAQEDRKLYKVFSKQRLRDLLQKIADSSLALMNKGKDPFGFPIR